MFPWVYEFRWEPTHIIFLVVFFSVTVLIAVTVVRATLRARKDMSGSGRDHAAWEAAFEGLPESARVCRHELSGEIKRRTCDHEFDCPTCANHLLFLAGGDSASAARAVRSMRPQMVGGVTIPMDRYYHRGHTWARLELDGTFTVGIDDLGKRLLGAVDAADLPAPGTALSANGTAFAVHTKHGTAALRSPMDGEVVATADPGDDWLIRMKLNPEKSLGHLLRGGEIRPWFTRELERLQEALANRDLGVSLADGGATVESLPAASPNRDWEAVWGEMFLEA